MLFSNLLAGRPDSIPNLVEIMKDLLGYHKLSKETGWHEEGESTVANVKALISRIRKTLLLLSCVTR